MGMEYEGLAELYSDTFFWSTVILDVKIPNDKCQEVKTGECKELTIPVSFKTVLRQNKLTPFETSQWRVFLETNVFEK